MQLLGFDSTPTANVIGELGEKMGVGAVVVSELAFYVTDPTQRISVPGHRPPCYDVTTAPDHLFYNNLSILYLL